MALTREQVIEYLSALSPDRLQDLILELEDIWGIERPASWWSLTMGVAMGEVSMGVPTWEVVLLDVGSKRVAVMKALRSMLDLSLVAARDLVDAVPAVVATDCASEEAKRLIVLLTDAGATAELR